MSRPLFFIFCLCLTGCPSVDMSTSADKSPTLNKSTTAISVTGQLYYQDRIYNSGGFISSQQPMKAIRNVPVELRDANEALIANTLADNNGDFQFSNIPEGNYWLRIIAQTEHRSGTHITIRSASGQEYAIEQAVSVSAADTALTFTATIEDRVAGIFNMLDVMTLGLDFIGELALNHATVDDLNVYWQWATTDATYTCREVSSRCPSGAGIYVLSDPLVTHDSDEFDDDVLWHEFTHHLESSWMMWDSPGGFHSLISNSLDLRLSWSEGMANAFSVSIKKWLKSSTPDRLSIAENIGEDNSNYYIDTIGTTTQISVDLQNAYSIYYRHITNEAAVACGILRLQNLTGIYAVWQQIFNTLTENSTADTMDAFWDGMVGSLQPGSSQLNQWKTTLASKQINYFQDDFESDDSVYGALPLALNEEQSHNLYRSYSTTDADWYRLSLTAGQSYRIETFNLINGADTELTLYGYDGQTYNQISSNDDAEDCGVCSPLHNGSHFSSRISYTAAYSGDYFVKVNTAGSVYIDPTQYGYIGRYGGYSIRYQEL